MWFERFPMIELFSGMAPALISLGLEKWGTAKEARLLRAAIRDRLHREVKLNLEVWKLYDKAEQPAIDLADLVSVAAFNEVCSLNLPLWAVLADRPALSPTVQGHLQQTGNAQRNGNYVRLTADIATEIDLIERIWHRLRVLKARHSLDGSLGDCAYLMHLHAALDLHLRECRANP
ncbi:MAG: hypothetical protein PHI55_08435 [Burkholderiaceae bacterium]|nr:hypothetical protein [Burkholderiaceae bacterium]